MVHTGCEILSKMQGDILWHIKLNNKKKMNVGKKEGNE
jgi:hypothetical protein